MTECQTVNILKMYTRHCQKCRKAFACYDKYLTHLLKDDCEPAGENLFLALCTTCGMTFENYFELYTHEKYEHDITSSGIYTDHCQQCGIPFTSPCQFLEHLLKVNCESDGDDLFVALCKKCGATFKSDFHLIMHKQYEHLTYRSICKTWRYMKFRH